MQGEAPEVGEEVAARLQSLCLALPEATVRVDRWAYSFEIRKRPFCLLAAPAAPDGRAVPIIAVRADPSEREVLLAIGHPYFAVRSSAGRVGVLLTDGTDWDEIAELVTESYRILAPKKLVALLDDP